MTLLPLFEWFEATRLGTVVRESLWLFPVIECVHLLALALLGGAVLVVDLRMLRLGLRSRPVAELARDAQPWLTGALVTMIATGVPMLLSEAIKCYHSPPFWWKMGLLVAATLFTYTVRRRVARSGAESAPTALASLGLWFGVGFAGRWIAFY